MNNNNTKSAFEALSEFEQVRLKKKLYDDAKHQKVDSSLFPSKMPYASNNPDENFLSGKTVLKGDDAKFFMAMIKQRRKRKNDD